MRIVGCGRIRRRARSSDAEMSDVPLAAIGTWHSMRERCPLIALEVSRIGNERWLYLSSRLHIHREATVVANVKGKALAWRINGGSRSIVS